VTERSLEIQTADGPLDLAVLEAGVGGRPLLLAHGFTGAKEDFADFVDPLAELGWHVVVPDHRGHGASGKPAAEEAYSFEAFATDLEALFDALGWSRAVVLGHSMGGMVVQVLATTAPERVEALVLMDTSHAPLRLGDPSVAEKAGAVALERGMEAILAGQADSPLDTPAHLRVVATRPGYREFGDRKLLSASPHMYASMIRAILSEDPGADRLESLRAVSVPTLVLVGDQDAPFLGPSARMAEAVAGAELVVLPDAGHSPQFEAPDAWWSALSGFLARV
jgi:3-oxoadipate enol-lactonase